MEWTDLRFFLAAVRGGNLSAAARELGVNYTTVGRRLDALQHGLGATLIQRTPDGLTLTRAGEAVKRAVRKNRGHRARGRAPCRRPGPRTRRYRPPDCHRN